VTISQTGFLGTEGYTGQVVFDTITNTGNYVITAEGAIGGSANPFDTGGTNAGGAGVELTATFHLAANDVLEIVVGGAGGTGGNNGAGGGGGSFVYNLTTKTLLEAAGGGSGGGYFQAGYNGVTSAGNAAGGAGGGTYGGGGGGGSSGGGGSGTGTTNFPNGGAIGGTGGTVGGGSGSYAVPTTGGVGYYANGGFGGGGGGGYNGGGGGGGFSGGDGGGGYTGLSGAGGGGSFIKSSATNASFTGLNSSGDGDAGITLTCFAAGTLIRTPTGDAAIETLAPGDLVTQTDGSTAPVTWVGVQTVSTVFGNSLRVLPIRVTAGALGENMPQRDMLISPDHALFIGGILVQASALVNGETIFREHNIPERFTYYHVELPTHALIFAENTPVESFVDNVDRLAFDNWAEHEARLGALPPLREMPYPRAKSARQLPTTLRQKFSRRIAA